KACCSAHTIDHLRLSISSNRAHSALLEINASHSVIVDVTHQQSTAIVEQQLSRAIPSCFAQWAVAKASQSSSSGNRCHHASSQVNAANVIVFGHIQLASTMYKT